MLTQGTSRSALLDATQAAFIQERVSISIGARGVDNMPSITRGLGVRVSTDRRQVTVLVPAQPSRQVLEDLRDNGAIAAVFTRPSTHQTLQLKGLDAEIVAPAAEDRTICAAWQESFVAELLELGYEERFARGVFAGLTGELVAVRFTPDAAFEQTPGPSAGQQLGSGV